MTEDDRLPNYEPMLAAYHRAFATELRTIVGSLPIAEGQTVLDMACGDGVYTPWLAERVGTAGRVVAVDNNSEYLGIARESSGKNPANIEFRLASIDSLPFREGTFDLCWCAQSLYSLPDPVESLKSLLRVTKPGGVVAVLEGDTLHHVILPWPVEVELHVRSAELRVMTRESNEPHKFYIGRNLRTVFREAGFEAIEVRTVAHDRAAPLGADEREYFAGHLKELVERVSASLRGSIRRKFIDLTDPGSDGFLLDSPDLTATCVDQVAWGRVPK